MAKLYQWFLSEAKYCRTVRLSSLSDESAVVNWIRARWEESIPDRGWLPSMAVGLTLSAITWVPRLLSAVNQRTEVQNIQVRLALKLRMRGAIALHLPPFLSVMRRVDFPRHSYQFSSLGFCSDPDLLSRSLIPRPASLYFLPLRFLPWWRKQLFPPKCL